MKKRACLIIFVFITALSCNKSECLVCTPEDVTMDEVEICEDSEITYTDIEGNVIPFEDLDQFFEDLGFECKYK